MEDEKEWAEIARIKIQKPSNHIKFHLKTIPRYISLPLNSMISLLSCSLRFLVIGCTHSLFVIDTNQNLLNLLSSKKKMY